MKRFLQHHFNDLHLYCRLCELGMSRTKARTIARIAGYCTSWVLYSNSNRAPSPRERAGGV